MLMELKRITNSDPPEARKLIALHGNTFPEYERFRGTLLLARLIDGGPAFYFNAIYQGDLLTGFFGQCDSDDFYYIRFTAVYPELRNPAQAGRSWSGAASQIERP